MLAKGYTKSYVPNVSQLSSAPNVKKVNIDTPMDTSASRDARIPFVFPKYKIGMRKIPDMDEENVMEVDGGVKLTTIHEINNWYLVELARIRFNPGRILRQRRSSRIRWA